MSAIASSELLSHVSRRGAAWLVIGAVHVALIYVVTSGAPVRVAFDATPIEASIVDLPKPLSEAPLPPPPQLEQPTLPVIEPPISDQRDRHVSRLVPRERKLRKHNERNHNAND